MMATVTKAQTLNTNKERVELIEIREFSERYRCMAKVFDVKEVQICWQVHLHGEAASFFFSFFPSSPVGAGVRTYMVKPLGRIGDHDTHWYVAWRRYSM